MEELQLYVKMKIDGKTIEQMGNYTFPTPELAESYATGLAVALNYERGCGMETVSPMSKIIRFWSKPRYVGTDENGNDMKESEIEIWVCNPDGTLYNRN